MIGIPLCTIVYILVNISYFSVMSVEELLNSPGVATVNMILTYTNGLFEMSIEISCKSIVK